MSNWACIHGYLHYSIVGGGGGGLPTTPHTLNTSSHNTAARRPPHPCYTQQHTTKHSSTRVHKTTNVPVVFMALILNGFEGCKIITRGIGRGGPWKSRLFGPWNGTSEASAIWAQKSWDFQGPPLPMPRVMMLHPSKPLRTAPKNNWYINSYYTMTSSCPFSPLCIPSNTPPPPNPPTFMYCTSTSIASSVHM